MNTIGDRHVRPGSGPLVKGGTIAVWQLALRDCAAASAIIFAVGVELCAPWAAQAQSARTYVSGRGSDSNACTQSAPCLTLQGALAKTNAGGEIYALNSA